MGNHNHYQQRKPETGHRETEQEHGKQPKQTQRNLRQNKSRRKKTTVGRTGDSREPGHP